MSRKESPGVLLHEFMCLVHEVADDHAMAVLQDSGLTLPQMIALDLLRRDQPRAIGFLARELRLSLSATSTLIQRLVDLELVTRTEDPTDRRHKQIALTRAGATLSDRLTAGRTQGLGRGLTQLPDALRAELVDVLARATDHLRERRDSARRRRSE